MDSRTEATGRLIPIDKDKIVTRKDAISNMPPDANAFSAELCDFCVVDDARPIPEQSGRKAEDSLENKEANRIYNAYAQKKALRIVDIHGGGGI